MKERDQKNSGFSLIEVAMAIGVAAFSLVAIGGLVPVGVNSSQSAASQTGATSLMGAVVSDLRSSVTASPTPAAAPKSPYFGFPITSGTTTLYVDESNTFAATLAGLPTARFRVTVSNVFNPTAPDRSASREYVLITWPAGALPANATGHMESIVALDRN